MPLFEKGISGRSEINITNKYKNLVLNKKCQYIRVNKFLECNCIESKTAPFFRRFHNFHFTSMVPVFLHFFLEMFTTFLSIPLKKVPWFAWLLSCKNLSEFPIRIGRRMKKIKMRTKQTRTSFQKPLIVSR